MSTTSAPVFGGAGQRYGLALAPDGLGLVHDLLLTSAAGRPRQPDLLESRERALAWAGPALAGWSALAGVETPELVLSDADVDQLRALRDDLLAALHDRDHPSAEPFPGRPWTVTLGGDLTPDGGARLGPRGSGWRLVASAVVLEVFLAQRAGTWQRLKVCRNHRCHGAFYDRSRNNSGVWHDVRVCGNAVNLRASRARRRAREAGDGAG